MGEPAATEVVRRGAEKRRGSDHVDDPAEPSTGPRPWVEAEAKAAGVRLSAGAVELIVGHLGENVGSLDGTLRTLSATFGAGAVLGPEQVEPFLGDAGGVPPWDLTDAIDGGRSSRALELVGRILGAGERHPLQVMAILQGHYGKLATLDGRDLRTEADAAAALGIKPGYPARKALEQARRLGGSSIRRAIDLLAAADLDLRGRRDLDSTLVIEILVARLSRLAAPEPVGVFPAGFPSPETLR